MKVKTIIKTGQLFMMAVLLAACANEDIAQDKKKENGTEAPKGGVVFATNDTKISAKRRFIDEDEFAGAKTRTNIKHTVGQGADAVWTSDDFIWVKKQDGTWAKSTAITLHDGGASAEFSLPGSKSDYADGCEVRYTGNSLTSYGSPAASGSVGFPKEQSRTAPNDFSKAGDWGDCGSGIARNTGNPDKFNFTLTHKSSYLCFLPRCENAALAPNIRLKGIKITSTSNQIFFSYIHDFDGEHLTEIGYPQLFQSINVTLPDFPLYTDARQEDNATYLVVPPDTYDFKIEYTIKDPTTNVEAVVTQTLTNKTFDKGNIYDVTANLTVPSLHTPKYYMWDARQDYWWGHLKPDGTPDGNYPKSKINDPERWFNTNYNLGNRYDAQTALFQTLPNANELCWYVRYGDPHTDYGYRVVARNGHLQNVYLSGGLWLRKKAAIVAYLKTQGYPSNLTWEQMKEAYWPTAGAPHIDYRVTPQTPLPRTNTTYGTPSNLADYFFLPALGSYNYEGTLYLINSDGNYWSLSAGPQYMYDAFTLHFSSTKVEVVIANRRDIGLSVQAFE